MPYYIIEHPTKGTLMDWMPNGDMWHFKWSWSKPRSESHRFPSLNAARAIYDLMPVKTKLEACIRQSPPDNFADWPQWPNDAWQEVYPNAT